MRRYCHYKKRPRPFPVEILSAMQDDAKPTPSQMHLAVKPFVECAKKYRATFEMIGSGLHQVMQELFGVNKRKSGI